MDCFSLCIIGSPLISLRPSLYTYIRSFLVSRVGTGSTASSVHVLFQLCGEEYEAALELAREYDLDCDRVYQRQWQSYQVSASTIQDYLVSVCIGYLRTYVLC